MIVQHLIDGVVALAPHQEAIEFEQQWTTWGTLGAAMASLSRALNDAGLGEHARIGVVLASRPQLIAAIAAMVSSRRCLVALNSTYPDSRLVADIAETGVPAVILDHEDWHRDALRDAIVQRDIVALVLDADWKVTIAHRPATPMATAARCFVSGTALEMLTSGTTGKPKRIALPRASFEKSLLEMLQFESRGAEDLVPQLRSGVQILTSPFAHIAGIQAVMNVLMSGRKCCVLGKFAVDAFVRAIVRHRPKVVSATPAAVRMIVDAGVSKDDLSSLVAFRTGAAALDPDLADLFYQRYGIPILQNYGATEFGGVAGWTPDDHRRFFSKKRGSVGRINKGIEARVTEPVSGAVLEPGELGLLELKAPHIGDSNEWLRTSDLAVLDADRFLWIKGRADGAIVRGGFKIQPEDVAAALQAHPAVDEAVVVGLPDSRLGAVPVAAYTLRESAGAVGEEELKAFLRDRLMPYQLPMRFLEVQELPRTESMKVSLVGVKELFVSERGEAPRPQG